MSDVCKKQGDAGVALVSRGRQRACVEALSVGSRVRKNSEIKSMADGFGVARIDGHADNEARERDREERSFTVGVLLESIGVGDERKRRGKVLPVKRGRKRTTGR